MPAQSANLIVQAEMHGVSVLLQDLRLELTVRSQDGRAMPICVLPGTQIAKIAAAISNRLSLAPEVFKLCWDCGVLRHWETPEQLGMESGDVIDMLMELTGD